MHADGTFIDLPFCALPFSSARIRSLLKTYNFYVHKYQFASARRERRIIFREYNKFRVFLLLVTYPRKPQARER